MEKRFEADQYGSILFFQKNSPGTGKEGDWLPVCKGRFSLQVRLNWPYPETLDPFYVMSAVKRGNER
jgi:hypothetical protein